MNSFTSDYYIEKLGLEPHYEGGWFKFIWKTDKSIPREVLGEDYSGDRASASHIFYMLKAGEVSSWHKLKSDEIWFWHAGGSLKMTLADGEETPAEKREIILGSSLDEGEQFQAVIPANIWQTSTPCRGDFVLVSCVVSPGFDDDDFMFPKGLGEKE